MPKKRLFKPHKGLIPKEWKHESGLIALPPKVNRILKQVFDKLRVGEEMRTEKFFHKLTLIERARVAYELSHSGMSNRDIATLFGFTIQGIYRVLEMGKEQYASTLGPQWLAVNFVDDIKHIQDDAAWFRSNAESAETPEQARLFRRDAMLASDRSAERLLKAQEILATLGKHGKDGEPDPSERVGMMQHVFETKVLKQIESKPEEAEVVDGAADRTPDA